MNDIERIIFRTGDSLARTAWFLDNLNITPDSVIKKESEMLEKYKKQLCLWKDDFIKLVKKYDYYKDASADEIWDTRLEVCYVIRKAYKQKMERDLDKEFLDSKFDTCPSCKELSPVQYIQKCDECGKTFCYNCGFALNGFQYLCDKCFWREEK